MLELFVVHFGVDGEGNDAVTEPFGLGERKISEVKRGEHFLFVGRYWVVNHTGDASALEVCLKGCSIGVFEDERVLVENVARVCTAERDTHARDTGKSGVVGSCDFAAGIYVGIEVVEFDFENGRLKGV